MIEDVFFATVNTLKSLNLSYNGVSTDNDLEYLTWEFNLEWDKFELLNNYISEYLESTIDIEWEFDPDTIISNLDSEIEVKTKSSTYDYDNWEYVYSDDFDWSFISKINIDNRSINWTTYSSSKDNSLEIKHEWHYSDEEFFLENSFSINSEVFEEQYWEIKWNFNIDTDYSNNKNNFYVLFNVLSWNKELINFEIENIWKRFKSDTEIDEPEDFISIDDIDIEDSYNNYYYY